MHCPLLPCVRAPKTTRPDRSELIALGSSAQCQHRRRLRVGQFRMSRCETMAIEQRLSLVAEKIRAGQFKDALDTLTKAYRSDSDLDKLLMAEIHLRLGAPAEVQEILRTIARPQSLKGALAARYFELLGWATKQEGDLTAAVELLTRSVTVAEASDELEQLCRSQLCLLSATVEMYSARPCESPSLTGPAQCTSIRTRRVNRYLTR